MSRRCIADSRSASAAFRNGLNRGPSYLRSIILRLARVPNRVTEYKEGGFLPHSSGLG